MTDDFELTRRKALAALGTIGVASAGAGLGTSAYFSDQETFENNRLTAGTLDMKVAATEYYSDWSPDEAEYAGMASDAASTDIRLPPGDGQTDAQAIALDLDDSYQGDVYGAFFETIETGDSVNGGVAAASDGLCGTDSDADGPMIIDIGDVKPGDFGGAQFAFELCDNPGYVWLTGGLRDASENGTTEPEDDDPDEESGVVELLDEIQVAYGVGPINDGSTAFGDTNSGFQPVEQYTLREFLATLNGDGIALDGDIDAEIGGGTGEQGCFAGGNPDESSVYEVSVVWWLPIDHGNQVQSDSVTFDLGFYTEQCRHNDGETDLVAYYPFEGSADDVSGNGYDGTINGNVSFTGGQVGRAASFDGDGDYLVADPSPSLSGSFTISVWLNGAGFSHTSYPLAVSKWQAGQNRDYLIGYSGPQGRLYAQFNREPDSNKETLYGPAPATDVWYHCVLTYDASSQEGTFYVDGTEVDSGSGPFNNTASSLVIGSKDGGGNPWDGLIDDVRIYSRALSASEVQSLYDSA